VHRPPIGTHAPDYPWPVEVHPRFKAPVIQCKTNWQAFLTDDAMLLELETGINTKKHLTILGRLDTLHVRDVALPPFEFDVLDTPNRDIAIGVTQLALAGEQFNTGVKEGNVALLKESKNHYTSGKRVIPEDTDIKLVPAIVKREWDRVIDVLVLCAEYKALPKPPQTLVNDQYKDLEQKCAQIYITVQGIGNKEWKQVVTVWVQRETMPIVAHHLMSALQRDKQKIPVDTYGKRIAEIRSLLVHNQKEALYISVTKEWDSGYSLDARHYKPILVDNIKTGAYFNQIGGTIH
jgi:hypothetical protein